MSNHSDKNLLQLIPEPTLKATHPPMAYAVIFPKGPIAKEFQSKAAQHGIEMHSLGDAASLLLSFDEPEYTLRWLRAIDSNAGKIVLVALSSYYIID